jgi:hypothetical protein
MGSNQAFAGYDFTPVIINLNSSKQADSIGFNLVKSLPPFIYKEILEGRVKLYSNASKKLVISPTSLVKLEQDAQSRFAFCEDLFFNQVWKRYGRNVEIHTVGFSFFTRKLDNTLLSFGFIDANDLEYALKSNIIPVNANGTSSLSYWEAIGSMIYDFQIVKFGNKDLVDKAELALKLKEDAVCKKRKNNFFEIPLRKDIFLAIYPNSQEKKDNALICNAFQNHFKENKQVLLEYINKPDLLLDPNYPIIVNEIRIREKWTLVDSKIIKETIQVTPYVNGIQVNTYSMNDLEELHLMVSFRPLLDLVEGRNYDANIIKVNNQDVPNEWRSKVAFALNQQQWNQLIIEN